MTVRFCALALALFAGGAPALRPQDPQPAKPEAGRTDIVFKLGGEADSDHGQLGEAKLSWRPSETSLLSGGYTYSTLAATNAAQTDTRVASLACEYGFGLLGLGASFDGVSESGLLASRTFALRPFLESGPWRVEVNGSRRTTDFDRFGFVNVPIVRPTGTIYVTGIAQLNLVNTGFGSTLDYLGEVWHAYASYDTYSYGNYEGETNISAIRDANGRVTQAVFNALASRLVTRLQRFAGSRATQKASLLDDSATAGLDATFQPFRLGLEGGRDTDHLTKNVSESLTGIFAVDANRWMTLELRGGATRSDKLGTIRFVGLSLSIRSIPRAGVL